MLNHNLFLEAERRHVVLISRALTLLQVTHRPIPWSGPLSRELLVFNSFSRTLGRTLRAHCEALVLNAFLSGRCQQKRSDFIDINLALPFGIDANTGLGIVIKTYLERVLEISLGKEPATVVADALHYVEGTFTGCSQIKTDLQRGIRFWEQLVAAVKVLKAEKTIQHDLYQQFVDADQWFSAYHVS
jgi:hypothetical protein